MYEQAHGGCEDFHQGCGLFVSVRIDSQERLDITDVQLDRGGRGLGKEMLRGHTKIIRFQNQEHDPRNLAQHIHKLL